MPETSASRQPGKGGPVGVHGPLWRAVAVFRVAALAYVVLLAAMNASGYAHPVTAWLMVAAMGGWTAFAWWAYARPELRRWPLLVADLGVTAGLELTTRWVVGREALDAGAPTLAVAWFAAPVLTWAVAGGRRLGVLAALVLGAGEVSIRGLNQPTMTGAMLMLLAAVAVGHAARLVVAAQRQLQRAVELEAATRERERLARGIHDSVLQVLALVQRRGAHLDGEAGELARLAGDQEAALRALISAGPGPPFAAGSQAVTGPGLGAELAPAGDGTTVDLRSVLSSYAGASVTISAPADPVPLPAHEAREIGRAVGAALDNVSVHCGIRTRAWVLVEDEPDAVTVTVRDDGPGFAEGRLAQARAQGRLGVAQSIRGRVADLGGTADITSVPGEGTEVELRLPRRA